MARKIKKMTDKDILDAAQRYAQDAASFSDTTMHLKAERKEVMEFYDGERPVKASPGGSSYVSQDVYDAVEAMHAQLYETFAAGPRVIQFAPQGPEDVDAAKLATDYTEFVLFRQNDADHIFQTAIKDGLLNRIGPAKVYWKTESEEEPEAFEGVTSDELGQLLAGAEDVSLGDEGTVYQAADGTFSGTLVKKIDKSHVCIEPIPPEDFKVPSGTKSLKTASAVIHTSYPTKSELQDAGYKRKVLDSIGDDHWTTDEDKQRRHAELGGLNGVGNEMDARRIVKLDEVYCYLDVEGTGVSSLYRLAVAGDVLLAKERIKRLPFVVFVPLLYPHRLYGNSYAKRVMPSQLAKTNLTRAVLDHTAVTTNPRYAVLTGGVTNPRELIDKRLGGIVNVTRPDAVTPLIPAPLNPFVFQTLQLLDYDLEDTSGISRLSQGLNKDAVSKQNAQATLEMLTSNSQTRQKVIARNFASTFLVPLYRMIYELVLEYEKQERIVELAGTWTEVNPSTWRARKDCTVELRLGYGEQEREADKLFALDLAFAQDPEIKPLYALPNRFRVLERAWELRGVKGVSRYLTPPEQAQPQGPSPEVMLKMEELKLEQQKVALEDRKQQQAHELAMRRLELDATAKTAQVKVMEERLDLDERKADDALMIAKEELAIAKASPDTKAIVSPNS